MPMPIAVMYFQKSIARGALVDPPRVRVPRETEEVDPECWLIELSETGLPRSAELLEVVSEARKWGLGWRLYSAELQTLGTPRRVETLVVKDLAWQVDGGAVRSGIWDDVREQLLMRGGCVLELNGRAPEARGSDC